MRAKLYSLIKITTRFVVDFKLKTLFRKINVLLSSDLKFNNRQRTKRLILNRKPFSLRPSWPACKTPHNTICTR